MTFPSFRNLLEQVGKDPSIKALGLEHDRLPIGLALGQELGEKTIVHSLYLRSEYRGMGLGKKLLGRFMECLSKKIYIMTFSEEHLPKMKPILQSLHWELPKPKMLFFQYDPRQIGKSSWAKKRNFPKSYELLSFSEITSEDKRRIWKLHQDPLFPKELSLLEKCPFPLEPLTSFILRKDGILTGWLATHRINEDWIRYTNLFVDETRCRKGIGIFLMGEAIRRHCTAQEYQKIKAVQGIPFSYPAMVQMAEKHLAPWAMKRGISYEAKKEA